MMSQNIQQIMRNTRRYYYEDGLIELAVGGLIAVSSLLMLILSTVEQGSPLAWIAGLGLPTLVIAGGFAVKRLVRLLKERLTYPRTGYIAYDQRRDKGRRWIVAVALLGAIALLFLPEWANRMSLIIGVLMATAWTYLGYRAGVPRLYGVAAVALVIGVAAALSGFDDALGSVVTFAAAGGALMLTGGAALIRYLRENPAPKED